MAKVPTRQPETGQTTAAVHDEVDTGHNKTQNTNTPRWWLIESTYTYIESLVEFSIQMQFLSVQHPANY